ncbi:MAG: hypothetical protein K0R98_1961 [Rickettsiaceae bacterium]|jgi:hypothetical protein|nr:hypothetical protein [Rickettsiaceae bacterium]
MINNIRLALLTLALSACAANPTVVEVSQATDNMLTCDQIARQIEETQIYKTEARKDDTFKLKYIWLPTGAMSAYRFNKAESSAVARIDHLTQLANQKGCPFTARTSQILNDELKRKEAFGKHRM